MLLLDDGTVTEDRYTRAGFEEGEPLPDANALLVPLTRLSEALAAGASEVGVEVPSPTELDELEDVLAQVTLVAVRMEGAADGRAFTLAKWLRERSGFTGQIRVTGPFVEDQLDYLRRCGFDAFELGPDHDEETARACLHRFSVTYQRPVQRPPHAHAG